MCTPSSGDAFTGDPLSHSFKPLDVEKPSPSHVLPGELARLQAAEAEAVNTEDFEKAESLSAEASQLQERLMQLQKEEVAAENRLHKAVNLLPSSLKRLAEYSSLYSQAESCLWHIAYLSATKPHAFLEQLYCPCLGSITLKSPQRIVDKSLQAVNLH